MSPLGGGMEINVKKEKNCRLGKVGGQAVLEGVMMKSGDNVALAVRKEDGTIALKNSTFVSARKKNKFLNFPLIRGCVNMVEMMRLSFSTLNDSTQMLGLDDMEPESKFDKWLQRKFGDKLMNIVMSIGMVLGVILSVGLFMILPNLATMWLNDAAVSAGGPLPSFVQNLISGLLRILIFIVYLLLVSRMKDIKRTFAYHGAEHKSVACYEAGLELTPENAATCTRFHPRCGTSFIFVILIISILVTSFINWNTWPRWAIIGTKLLMLPVIVGIGFEFLMLAGKHPNPVTRALSAPGLWMQRITTKEPDAAQLEVAITALKNAMPEEFGGEAPTGKNRGEDSQSDAVSHEGGVPADSSSADGEAPTGKNRGEDSQSDAVSHEGESPADSPNENPADTESASNHDPA